ncbi:CubicO group peptidase, beta-lactamase class C family [Tistlia consotensis]|uniref:CubicO group peptidase, beta-lactamase class C family n=1 Tax=Tistlia consotensis USBA 355 TaxID=560819 RepID=A0A1Y6CHA5_9PROT|nr:serine hydrolase [Tistlia consotensis]SMF65242.1 CubicO group peptidase, beta-lactamase class C family [Tistlia consotensis USBA 355]SNS03938.1 CubicO group peptidase, beta-lactamase class C family [Tistlia consotensis]
MTNPTIEPPSVRPRTARELGIMQGFPPPPEKRPTLADWDLAPMNRWAFQHVRGLIPTVEVPAAAAPWELPAAHQDLSAIRFRDDQGRERTIGRWLADSYTDGFLAWHRGRVVAELYLNDMTPATLHLAQSVSKSVVGTTAGILVGQGLLDPDAPFVDYVPEMAASGYGDARLTHAFDMTSGVRFTEDYNAPDSDMTRIDVASGWRPAPDGAPRPTIRDVLLGLPKQREHGLVFDYRSIETDALAWAMERATGKPLAALVSELLWQPMGAEREACFTVDGAGTALADGGFNAGLRDFARLGRLLLEGGRRDGRQLVPADWIGQIRRGGDPAKFGAPYTEVCPRGAYSRQWWTNDRSRGDVMARGVFGQLIYVDPEGDFLAVKLSSWPDYLIPAFSRDSLAALAAIRQALG